MFYTFTRPLQRLVVALVLLSCPFLALGQIRSAIDVEEWPTGEVVLTTGETMTGALTYHHNEDVVQVKKPDGAVSSYSPVNVEYFTTSVAPGMPRQTFRTYPWNLGKDYSDFKKPTFFQQLNEGKLTLIMRETYVQQDISRSSFRPSYGMYYPYGYPSGSNWIMRVKEIYYVLLPNGEIKQLRNVRKDLQQLCGKKFDKIKAFVKMNKLDYDNHHHLVAVVNYYNTLQ